MDRGALFSADTFLWGLAAICQLQRNPFAPNLVLQQFAPPYDLAAMQEAAQALNVRSGAREIERNLAKSPAVQPVAEIKREMAARLDDLHRTADRIYARWIGGLRTP